MRRGFFLCLKLFKGEVKNKYEFWAAQDALNSVLFKWDSYTDEDLENDPDKVRSALQDFCGNYTGDFAY